MKRLIRKANKMFYHGTTYDNALTILKSRSISPLNQNNNQSHNTINSNAVFLTDTIIDAINYSQVTNATAKNELGVVFEIELAESDMNNLQPGDDVLPPEQRAQILMELGLIEDASNLKGYELQSILERYSEEITEYIQQNYSWQDSLDIVSEVAYTGSISLNNIIGIRLYYNQSDFYQSESPDVNSLEELADSIMESEI